MSTQSCAVRAWQGPAVEGTLSLSAVYPVLSSDRQPAWRLHFNTIHHSALTEVKQHREICFSCNSGPQWSNILENMHLLFLPPEHMVRSQRRLIQAALLELHVCINNFFYIQLLKGTRECSFSHTETLSHPKPLVLSLSELQRRVATRRLTGLLCQLSLALGDRGWSLAWKNVSGSVAETRWVASPYWSFPRAAAYQDRISSSGK